MFNTLAERFPTPELRLYNPEKQVCRRNEGIDNSSRPINNRIRCVYNLKGYVLNPAGAIPGSIGCNKPVGSEVKNYNDCLG
jgi:hypothetical protein